MDREKALEKFLFDYELIYIKIIDIIPGELLLVQKRRETNICYASINCGKSTFHLIYPSEINFQRKVEEKFHLFNDW